MARDGQAGVRVRVEDTAHFSYFAFK